jgi:hypothetical protein
MSTAGDINVSHADAYDNGVRAVDAALRGGHYVRYVSDPRPGPDAGLWRTGGDGVRELISPFALVEIEAGRHGCGITVIQPGTGNVWIFEGDLDEIASALHRAGQQRGCQADRKRVYWALNEFVRTARRQRAARGVAV